MKGRSKSQITPQDGLIIHTSQPFTKNVHVLIHAGKCFAMLTVSYMGNDELWNVQKFYAATLAFGECTSLFIFSLRLAKLLGHDL